MYSSRNIVKRKIAENFIKNKLGLLGTASSWQPWEPKSEPQRIALESPADIIGFGGSAGGGKSSVLQIMAVTQHQRSIIFRREYPRLKDIIHKARKHLSGSGAVYNSNEKIWRNIPGGRTLEFGAAQHEKDIENWRGIEHDLKAIDEATEFSLDEFLFLTGWCRSPDPNQKCTIIFTFNPPSRFSGRWVVDYLAPWIDPKYEGRTGKPLAEPGELRWFIGVDGKDTEIDIDKFFIKIDSKELEVKSPEPIVINNKKFYPKPKPILIGDEYLEPKSRTFIRATLDDNPYLRESGYRGLLQSLPEPLRSQLLYGDMNLGIESDPNQVIPLEWLDAAMSRWLPYPQTLKQTHIGVDVARGGKDKTVLVSRWDTWVDEPMIFEGTETPDGMVVAQQIARCLKNPGVSVQIDVIGVGAAVHDACQRLGMKVNPLKGSESAKDSYGKPLTDRSGLLTFANCRTYWYWNLRELLDPSNPVQISIPLNNKLKEELCSFLWWESGKTISITKKEEVKERIGRSPDLADAVVYAFADNYKDVSTDWML